MPIKTSLKKITNGFAAIFLIIFLLFLIAVASGTAYYYLEILTPAQYAKAVIPIYDELRSGKRGASNLQGGGGYEDALTTLNQDELILTHTRDQLLALKPSPINNLSFLINTQRSQQVQEDFTKILEFFLANISKAQHQAQFIIKAKELFVLLRPDLTTYPPKAVPEGQGVPSPPPPSTAGEFLAVWEPRIPKAKTIAQELFNAPQDVQGVPLEELKSLWQETEQGLDALLPFLRKQDPKLSLSEAQKLVPEGEKVLFAKVDKIDEFLPKLESLLIRNSAESILRYQFEFDNSKRSEFEIRFKRLDNNIKQLKEKFGQ